MIRQCADDKKTFMKWKEQKRGKEKRRLRRGKVNQGK